MPLELARARRSRATLTVAVVDLDHFKAYNDEHGHAAGDSLLADCARLWQEQLREVDFIARIGGEEFGLALPGCSETEAVDVLSRLRTATSPLRTISAGIAEWDRRRSGRRWSHAPTRRSTARSERAVTGWHSRSTRLRA